MEAGMLTEGLPPSCFEAPPFWKSGLAECHEFVTGLPGVEVEEIGRSAGGRPILAASFGRREALRRSSTSMSSSFGGWGSKAWNPDTFYPPSFFGESPRERPVLVLQGNIHGSEIAGTVAAMNLLNLLVHGTDLRGRRHDRLLEEARKMRVIVIPHANPDGRARWEPAKHLLTASETQGHRVTFGLREDGTTPAWLETKNSFPMPMGRVLGSYFNDAGVNLQHDRFLDAGRAPETDALLSFYLREMPDAVVAAHTDQGTLISEAPSYIPVELQTLCARIGGAVAGEVRRRRLPLFVYPHANRPGAGTRAFTQLDAIYHQCGALPLLVEFPSSIAEHLLTFDQVLDVGLAVFEALLVFGNDIGFRPGVRKHLNDGRVVRAYGPLPPPAAKETRGLREE